MSVPNLTPNPTVESGNFLKSFNFTDVVEKADGKVDVWGVATWEKPDSDNEIADYASAKPVYQAWSAAAAKRTKNAGQDISLGNVRIQHSSTLGGKATKIEYDDDEKEIRLGSQPANDEVHNLLKGGFLTGYSQGGSYAWRACEKCDSQMPMQQGANFCESCGKFVTVRYGLKRLAEVSYVDSPAIMEGFIYVKANGSQELVKFKNRKSTEDNVAKTKRVAGVDLPSNCFAYVGDAEKADTWELAIEFPGDKTKSERHVRSALARVDKNKGIPDDKKPAVKAKIEAAAAALAKSDTASMEIVRKRIAERAVLKGLSDDQVQKGLYSVASFARVLEDLSCMYEMAVYEREIEGDESVVPDDLKELLDNAIDIFISMATEEARELAANHKKVNSNQGASTMKTAEEIQQEQEAVAKAAKKSLASHFAKSANFHEKMADHHEKLAAVHEKADVGCKDCMGKADSAKAAQVEAAKAEAAEKGEVYKEAVGSGTDHSDVHSVLSNMQSFHKAAGAVHTKIAAMHDKRAEHMNSMADSQDEESAKATREEMKKADEAEAKLTPVDPAPVAKDNGLEADLEKAKQARRESPEYKAMIDAIAKAETEGELAKMAGEKLAGQTIAPTGTALSIEAGQELLKSLRIAPRPKGGEAEQEIELVGASKSASSSGL